jgi:hypothetical protein
LISILVQNPESWLGAKLVGWKRPASYEWQALADVFDLLALINSKKKPKPYPRPWKNPDTQNIGRKGQAREKVLQRLRQMNNRGLED